ncbi:ERCC4 domain-containing protein [Bacillus sp. 7884-1]|uniref:ERCC4 domain-containing protein n=1 Tax=Bacillus sp. 7884-1 TaxID=2021693 RepID=UPI000BA695C8|nr:ERCC4 domain-containing protein [Bacillus sp. 7884-1]PAE31671.1 nuclease [Bacillus sp. 7884-1]
MVKDVAMKYKYTETEIKTLLSSIVILVDSREQQNKHIIDYLESKKIPYKERKLDYGDYSAYLPKHEKVGIYRDLFIPAAIERKNSVDELVSTIKERTRFENELIRAQQFPFLVLVEDSNGYEKIIKGDYRSEYQARSLLGSLKAFEARYGFQTVFVAPHTSGNYIYHHFYYTIRNALIKTL